MSSSQLWVVTCHLGLDADPDKARVGEGGTGLGANVRGSLPFTLTLGGGVHACHKAHMEVKGSFFTKGVSGMELRPPGLEASNFTH